MLSWKKNGKAEYYFILQDLIFYLHEFLWRKDSYYHSFLLSYMTIFEKESLLLFCLFSLRTNLC